MKMVVMLITYMAIRRTFNSLNLSSLHTDIGTSNRITFNNHRPITRRFTKSMYDKTIDQCVIFPSVL